MVDSTQTYVTLPDKFTEYEVIDASLSPTGTILVAILKSNIGPNNSYFLAVWRKHHEKEIWDYVEFVRISITENDESLESVPLANWLDGDMLILLVNPCRSDDRILVPFHLYIIAENILNHNSLHHWRDCLCFLRCTGFCPTTMKVVWKRNRLDFYVSISCGNKVYVSSIMLTSSFTSTIIYVNVRVNASLIRV